MVCPKCKKENKSDAKFCKHCGAVIEQKYKTCKNGHNYDSSLNECPYCPRTEVSTAVKTSSTTQKTVIDKQVEVSTAPEISSKKTATAKPAVSVSEQKTELKKS